MSDPYYVSAWGAGNASEDAMSTETLYVSPEWLREHHACIGQVETYEREFGSAPVEVTADVIRRAARVGLTLNWYAEHILSGDRSRAYDEAIAPAIRAYEEACATAIRAYHEAIAPAIRAYEEAIAPASRAYQEACADALISALGMEVER